MPAAAFAAVGTSTGSNGPSKISGPALVIGGKPTLFWYGAEYCPYCAAERWPLVVALSRFGTWSSLQTTTSASQDVYPNTATFTFYGATYSSPYLAFQSVETQTNQRVNGNYEMLQAPDAAQVALVAKYDTQGAIPFVDFGNRYIIVGASYSPGVLSGKSPSAIAGAIDDPTTAIAGDVLGTANSMTAAICNLTRDQPKSVCSSPPITGKP